MRASWVFVALAAYTAVWAHPARAEEPVRVVIAEFDGPGSVLVRREVVRALDGRADLVPRREYEAAADARGVVLDEPSGVAAAAGELDVDAVVEGTVAREGQTSRVMLAVRDGNQGAVVFEDELSAPSPSGLRRKVRRRAWRQLRDALSETGRTAPDEPEPNEPVTEGPAALDASSESTPAEAPPSDDEEVVDDATREVGGHRFALPAHVSSPFTNTELGMYTGASLTRIMRAPVGAANQRPETPESVAAVELGADLQLRVAPALAVRLRVGGLGALATDARIGETSGAALGWSVDLGLVLSAPVGPVQLGVSGDVGRGDQHALRPIVDIAAEYEATGDIDAFQDSGRIRLGARAHAAVGMHPAVGLLGWVGLRPADPVGLVGATEAGPTAGAALSLDLDPVSSVPLALAMTYAWWSGGGESHHIAGGVYYSGHDHVSVGLEGGTVQASSADLARGTWSVLLHTRVFW